MSRIEKIAKKLWSDPRFLTMTDDAKLAGMFILFHPNIPSTTGVMVESLDTLAKQLGWDAKRFRTAIYLCNTRGHIVLDRMNPHPTIGEMFTIRVGGMKAKRGQPAVVEKAASRWEADFTALVRTWKNNKLHIDNKPIRACVAQGWYGDAGDRLREHVVGTLLPQYGLENLQEAIDNYARTLRAKEESWACMFAKFFGPKEQRFIEYLPENYAEPETRQREENILDRHPELRKLIERQNATEDEEANHATV